MGVWYGYRQPTSTDNISPHHSPHNINTTDINKYQTSNTILSQSLLELVPVNCILSSFTFHLSYIEHWFILPWLILRVGPPSHTNLKVSPTAPSSCLVEPYSASSRCCCLSPTSIQFQLGVICTLHIHLDESNEFHRNTHEFKRHVFAEAQVSRQHIRGKKNSSK